MAVRDGILALLGEGPRHGYQLKFDLEAAAGAAWEVNIGQIYTTLQRLDRDGLVEQVESDAEGRVTYAITDEGRRRVDEWYSSPIIRRVATRDDLALKVKIAARAPGDVGLDVISSEREAARTALRGFEEMRAESELADEVDLAWLLHIDRLIHVTGAELAWLDVAAERLASTRADASTESM